MNSKPLIVLPALLAVSLAACATSGGDDPAQAGPAADHACNADNVGEFIGQKTSTAIGAAIQRRTGATIFQWVPPDSAVTMDFRQERVRVFYDRAMMITRITCG